MSKLAIRLLALALFIGAGLNLGFAQQTVKIGLIDSQKVLENSVEGKRVLAQLTERDKKIQTDIAKLDDQIRQLEVKLNTQRLTLTEEAVNQIAVDLERKRTDRKRLAEDSVRELQETQFRLFNRVQSELLPIIEQMGKEKSLEAIYDLSKSGIVWFSPAVDITAEVIRRYDAAKAAPPAK